MQPSAQSVCDVCTRLCPMRTCVCACVWDPYYGTSVRRRAAHLSASSLGKCRRPVQRLSSLSIIMIYSAGSPGGACTSALISLLLGSVTVSAHFLPSPNNQRPNFPLWQRFGAQQIPSTRIMMPTCRAITMHCANVAYLCARLELHPYFLLIGQFLRVKRL